MALPTFKTALPLQLNLLGNALQAYPLGHFYGDSKSSPTDNLELLLQAAQDGLVADLPLLGVAFTVPLLPVSSWFL